MLLSSGELFRRTDLRRPARRRLGRVIDSFLELHEGDLVVHVAHGIARYRGLKLLEKNGQVEEHLELEFRGRTKLYVPASKIGLVQKYVGGSKSRPTLARAGRPHLGAAEGQGPGGRQRPGRRHAGIAGGAGVAARHHFPVDTEWQHEFDASFPYDETPDQLTTIEAIKRDMRQSRPMDRLLCGDVGYGKTEMAMRAGVQGGGRRLPGGGAGADHGAGRAAPADLYRADGGVSLRDRRPVAVLHARQQARIIDAAGRGRRSTWSIGTHRLAQPDVQFHNLGLVIIDEEQRFGVEVKERLKAFRQIVDVLTMTATPIPRTLHMSLLGVRDISNLETPPEDRLAVETRVTRFQGELIRHAVMRELNRGGQIFFVHNRVQDIEILARRLRQIVPEARLGIAHGQMPEHELEQVMLDFVDHRFDLLLATTIVESGLDIPNANTIFIDEADRYGLADLHQLRGRVGRYKHRAYCYLLVDPEQEPLARRRPSGCGPSRSSATWGPASPSPCATWRSAGRATSWAPSRAGTSPRWATSCTAAAGAGRRRR